MLQYQKSIVAWASNVMQSPTESVILDTETTDFEGQIVDLSIIDCTGAVLFDSLIQPANGERITEGARRVHGISDEMLSDSPTLALAWPDIYDVLRDKTCIIAYNSSFDALRLSYSCNQNGLVGVSSNPSPSTIWLLPPWSCLMRKYADYHAGRRDGTWQKLCDALSQCGIEHDNWHRSLGDCQATLKLLRHLASLYVVPVPVSVEGGGDDE